MDNRGRRDTNGSFKRSSIKCSVSTASQRVGQTETTVSESPHWGKLPDSTVILLIYSVQRSTVPGLKGRFWRESASRSLQAKTPAGTDTCKDLSLFTNKLKHCNGLKNVSAVCLFRCSCGQLVAQHSSVPAAAEPDGGAPLVQLDVPTVEKWSPPKHTHTSPTDAYGVIEFQGGGHNNKAMVPEDPGVMSVCVRDVSLTRSPLSSCSSSVHPSVLRLQAWVPAAADVEGVAAGVAHVTHLCARWSPELWPPP